MDTSPQNRSHSRPRTESKGYEARKNVDETGKRETGATKEAFLFGLYIVIQGMSTIDSSYRCMFTATSSPALFSDFPPHQILTGLIFIFSATSNLHKALNID